MATITASPSLNNFLSWSDRTLNFEKTPKKNIFWLDTMEFFCTKLGHPEKSFKSIHVAGSKGKGSVSRFASAILEEKGYKTGLYSSPHIIDFAERITCSGKPFDEEVYSKAVDELILCVDNTPLNELPGERPVTWFELVTLLAFLCFKHAGCQWAVIEVGLGGRLDATNVIVPEVSCITQIELEHTEYLGDTLEKIAFEKGGIIKSGIPVFVEAQNDNSVCEVFKKLANERKSELVFCNECSEVYEIVYKSVLTNVRKDSLRGCTEEILPNERSLVTNECSGNSIFTMSFSFKSPCFSRTVKPELKLAGAFQIQNAVLAGMAVKKCLPDLDEKTVEKGLNKAWLPGRFETVCSIKGYEGIPVLVLDGAHTPRSVSFTMDTWSSFFGEKKDRAHLLFACAADKDVEHIASMFAGKFSRITLTRPGEDKACDFDRIKNAFAASGAADAVKYATEAFPDAIKSALEKASEEKVPLLVTGSFYLVSEVKKILLKACE